MPVSAIKIGVCEWALPVGGPLGVVLSAEMGFAGLQLADGGGAAMQYPMSHPRVQAAYLQAAADAGVEFGSMHLRSVFQDKSIDAPDNTEKAQLACKSIQKAILTCKAMGVPAVMATAIVREEEALPNVIRNLRYGCALARDNGVAFTLETNLDNEGIYRLVEAVGEDLGVCFDTCNPFIYETGLPQVMLRDMLEKDPGRIHHYHVKDTRTEEFLCGHPAPVIAGTGGSGLAETAAIIRESGYTGWVYSEAYYFARPINQGGDFMQIAAEDCAAIKRIFAVMR